jgi:hypothetical protein
MNYGCGQDFIRPECGCVRCERKNPGRGGRKGGQGEQYRGVCVSGGEGVRVDRLWEELHVCELARSRGRSLPTPSRSRVNSGSTPIMGGGICKFTFSSLRVLVDGTQAYTRHYSTNHSKTVIGLSGYLS